MQDLNRETMSRRAFLKDGLRSAMCGGFIVLSVIFGWRKYTKQGSCPASLPCGRCLKLSDCCDPRAIDIKRKQTLSGPRSLPMKKRVYHGE